MDEAKQVLQEIARLGRQARYRRNDFSSAALCRWEPYTIENPETGLPFSDASAWEFICNLLIAEPERFVEVNLEKPVGQIAYWAVVTLCDGVAVYIKVQLVQGLARGRSFHISTKGVGDV